MSKIKKRLLGYTKTKHFQKRQQEREVSDHHILSAFKEGIIKESEGHYRITFEHLNIILDLESNTLITVHPGDPAKNKPKLLSKEEAREIKSLIEARSKALPASEVEGDEFIKFIKDHAIKKLNQ